MQTILLVDDEPATLSLCQRILTLGAYEVLTAGSGEEALRVLQNITSLDLLLSDVVMPGMNGIELANRIRSTHPNTKVVLMSGYAPPDIEEVAGGQNPYRIIWKPFKTESLLRMIENVFDQPANSDPPESLPVRDFLASEKN